MKSTRFNEIVDWTQFAGEDGFVLSIATNGCSVKIASDALRPVPDNEKPVPNDFKSQLAGRVVVFEEYFFPEIVFTDNVDGVVDYEMTVTDPYNVSQSLGKNATSFLPEYEGVYIFEISARDKKGNVYTDKFSVMTVLADGAPMLYQENVPEKNGRTGVAYTVEPLVYDDDKVDTLDVYVVGPDGKRLSDQTLKTRPDRFGNTLLWQFTPSQVGEYRVMFYAGNSFGAAKIMNRVYVKYNTEGGNVYEMFRDEEHWEGSVSGSVEGIVVSGDADCKLPFSLEEGVCLDLTLSDRMDSWFALHFSNEPGQQRFYFSPGEYTANGIAAGLHVLIYRQQSGYYCDAFYVGLQGVAMAVVNHTSCGADRNVKISLKKNANMDDNICFYINGKLNENYEIANSCKASVCSDNEGFTYLSFSNLTNGDAVIHSVDVYDSIAPEIRINGNLSDYVGKGTTVRIPEISAIDAHDGEMPFTATLYSPDGKKMDTDGSFVAEQDGIYYLIVKSSDLTGNVSYVIFEIGSGNTEKKTVFGTSSETESASAKKGCKGSVGEIGGFGFLLFLSGVAITAKRKISHEH